MQRFGCAARIGKFILPTPIVGGFLGNAVGKDAASLLEGVRSTKKAIAAVSNGVGTLKHSVEFVLFSEHPFSIMRWLMAIIARQRPSICRSAAFKLSLIPGDTNVELQSFDASTMV